MTRTLDAVYKNGALHPLEPLALAEEQKVRLTILDGNQPVAAEDWIDSEFLQAAAAEADEGISLEQVQQALAKIPGSLTADFIAERDER